MSETLAESKPKTLNERYIGRLVTAAADSERLRKTTSRSRLFRETPAETEPQTLNNLESVKLVASVAEPERLC